MGLSFKSSSSILHTSPLLDIRFANVSSHTVACLFRVLTVPLEEEKFYILMKSEILLSLTDCAFGV